MNRSELSDLIATARGFDDRIEAVMTPYQHPETSELVEDVRITAWMLVLHDVPASLALTGLAELYRQPQMLRLQPGHIREAALKVRHRRVAQADVDRLEPPDEDQLQDEEGRTLSARWRQSAVEAIGMGASIEQAQQAADHRLGVKRRTIGAPVTRLQLETTPGAAAVASLLGKSA